MRDKETHHPSVGELAVDDVNIFQTKLREKHLKTQNLTYGIRDCHGSVLEVHSRVEPVVVGVLEAEPLDGDIVNVASRQDHLQHGHDGDEVGRHSLGRDPRHGGHISCLGADELAGAVQHRQVVDHDVPEVSGPYPGPDCGVAQGLLEHNFVSPILQCHIRDSRIFVDPRMKVKNLRLI